jgi:hypothetical protein
MLKQHLSHQRLGLYEDALPDQPKSCGHEQATHRNWHASGAGVNPAPKPW